MTIKEIRELTNLNKKEFAEKYSIPYRTVQNWECKVNNCPPYVLDLLEFKVKSDFPQEN